jgi:hypothetical protein
MALETPTAERRTGGGVESEVGVLRRVLVHRPGRVPRSGIASVPEIYLRRVRR